MEILNLIFNPTLVFIGYIVFNILTKELFSKDDKVWYWITSVVMWLLSSIILWFNMYNTQDSSLLIFFIPILFIGYLMTSLNMYSLKNASDTNVTRYQDKTLFSTIIFAMCGLFGYFINHAYSNNCSIPELLCNNSLVYIIIILNITVYQSVHYIRYNKNKTLFSDKDTDSSSLDAFPIMTLCLWQIYMYFLIDGIKDGPIITSARDAVKSQYGSGNPNTMHELFSFLSVVLIPILLGSMWYIDKQCDKVDDSKVTTIDNIKEISYNMIGTLITTFIIAFTYSI